MSSYVCSILYGLYDDEEEYEGHLYAHNTQGDEHNAHKV